MLHEQREQGIPALVGGKGDTEAVPVEEEVVQRYGWVDVEEVRAEALL